MAPQYAALAEFAATMIIQIIMAGTIHSLFISISPQETTHRLQDAASATTVHRH